MTTPMVDGGKSLTEEVAFLVLTGVEVFTMQTGFAMLTAGAVRSKNVVNALTTNVFDCAISALAFFVMGFAFQLGTPANRFIGTGNFALAGLDPDLLVQFFFHWTFVAVSTTIVSGAVAERISFTWYLIYAAVYSATVYPIFSHWVWSPQGWMSGRASSNPLFDQGAIDFAGSTVVHLLGGVSSIWGALALGPRMGRFPASGRTSRVRGHSLTLMALGTLLLWIGWYGFNCGSVYGFNSSVQIQVTLSDGTLSGLNIGRTIARCAVNTTLSACAGGIATLILVRIQLQTSHLPACLNGLLSGLVAITAGCGVVEPYAAVIIGVGGGLMYIICNNLICKLRIDDPLEAFPVHAGAGFFGTLMVGFFAREQYLAEAGYRVVSWGVFYNGGGRLLACQIVLVLCAIAWGSVTIGLFFWILRATGTLRVSEEEELVGHDYETHGSAAYPEGTSLSGLEDMSQRITAKRSFDVVVDEATPTHHERYRAASSNSSDHAHDRD
uniref:Ammonium transporter n=1 Tax=Compsopogon caeruleus TaxID=31354 RepID=A0A7S1XG18_9RHOD|eukprot:CAMPEP_0184680166 /NCGR_PEP_ID=MMETSP0312-20130426/3045_1 /TAXON_ID=31354 /ORGANISM="Compsopogon coeruleus, Strain SAG 36.94" /LENGTH=495 /DNA_ID=CAMNT_0027130105 /DNA_START=15 /DNA_END=1502 /DNA_ORIENTATION=-